MEHRVPNRNLATLWIEDSARQESRIEVAMHYLFEFKNRIANRRNYSHRWILGAESVRTSNIRAIMYMHTVNLLKKEQAEASGSRCSSYAPIAKASSMIPNEEREQLCHKFEIAYFLALKKVV